MGYQSQSNISAWDDRETKRRMRNDLVEWLQSRNYDYALTLGFNFRDVSRTVARKHLRRYDAELNRRLNGTCWLKKTDERIFWVAFPENMDTNPHWHMVVALDRQGFHDDRSSRYADFERLATEAWLKQFPTGTAHCAPLVGTAYEWYITKDFEVDKKIEEFVVEREFWPA